MTREEKKEARRLLRFMVSEALAHTGCRGPSDAAEARRMIRRGARLIRKAVRP